MLHLCIFRELAVAKHKTWPQTRTANPQPPKGTTDWVIWAAWADRVTFEEIFEQTGLSESEVIRLMRRTIKPKSFARWRRRATTQSIKHRKRFQRSRETLKRWDDH